MVKESKVTTSRVMRVLVAPMAMSGLILWLLSRVTSWSEFAAVWAGLDWRWVAVAGLGYGVEVSLIGLRHSMLLARAAAPPLTTLLASNVHNFVNKILPARTGELAFPILMRRYTGTSGTRALGVLVLARVIDLYLVLVAFTSVYISQRDRPGIREVFYPPLVGLVWAGMVALSFVLFTDGFWTRWLERAERMPLRPLLGRVRAAVFALWHELQAAWRAGLTEDVLPSVIFCSALSWAVLYGVFVALGQAMRLELGPGDLLIGASVAILGSILPIGGVGHFGGLEAGWTIGLVAVGATRSEAAASALVISAMTTTFAFCLAALCLIALEVSHRRRTATVAARQE